MDNFIKRLAELDQVAQGWKRVISLCIIIGAFAFMPDGKAQLYVTMVGSVLAGLSVMTHLSNKHCERDHND